MEYIVRCFVISDKTKKLIIAFPLIEALGGLDRIVYQSDGWKKIILNNKIIKIGGYIEKNMQSNFRVIADNEETLLEVYFTMLYLNKTKFTLLLENNKYLEIEIERVDCE